VNTWIIKINTILSQNIWFLWAWKLRDGDKYIPSYQNKHKTLSKVSLTAANIPRSVLQFLAASNRDSSPPTTNCNVKVKVKVKVTVRAVQKIAAGATQHTRSLFQAPLE
jgi:hypothetical protein